MKRRDFLGSASLALGASALNATSVNAEAPAAVAAPTPAAADWTALRDLFPLTRDYIHLATFLLASHPAPVTREIEKHRQGLDNNPADYYHEHFRTIDIEVATAAANYMGGKWDQIALTDSTTMGSAMVYSGLKLNPGDEMLQTVHDHYSTDMSLAHKAERSGAIVKRVTLYDNPADTSVEQCQQRLQEAISDKTRMVAVTWVHSSTGVKLPIKALAEVVNAVNAKRNEADHIIFCVDGVHGFGIENEDVSQLGCDFFIAGTHKWIFGPRGTGVVWGSDKGWARSEPVIPSFSASFAAWLGMMPMEQVPTGMHFTPGGFHSFEHRWALPAAFELHLQLGKANVQQRIHELNTRTKEGLAAMPHVTLRTPMSPELSSGLVAYEVAGKKPGEIVEQLHEKAIITSASPYRESYARFAPSLLNNETEIDRALAAVQAMG
ncbi:MAG: selenocysteine lyase/cysteine desulfurase [Bacteroidia bacterium]|jgi:selenocysteine lyase/cysteine desulfurase